MIYNIINTFKFNKQEILLVSNFSLNLMNTSKKHHYLPQFYLNGFTNNHGQFYVFDKIKEEIRQSTPTNSFFEKYRNTTSFEKGKSSFIEDMYTHFDTLASVEFNKVSKSSIENFKLEPEVLHRIVMFMTQIYWRVPKNDKMFEALINKLPFSEIGIDYVDKETGKSLLNYELQEKLKNSEPFRKMCRLLLPLISKQKKYKRTDFENWRVYFRGNKLQVLGDNPLIIKNYVDFSSLNGELVFPLCADKIIVHTAQNKPKDLPSNFILYLDILEIQQANRFACCSDKLYLENLVEGLYSHSKNCDLTEMMKFNLFKHFG